MFLHVYSKDSGSDWVGAQADLSLRWVHMPFWFYHAAAHMRVYHKTARNLDT